MVDTCSDCQDTKFLPRAGANRNTGASDRAKIDPYFSRVYCLACILGMTMRIPSTPVFITALCFGLSIGPTRTGAWESDVHYGLTLWLAVKAGYSSSDAKTIADANQGVDDSWLTGPLQSTAIAACLTTPDSVGAVTVHGHHFASERDPPDSPANRHVTPGKIWKQVRERPIPQPSDGNAFLTNLGHYLHSFQDSWSHQGEPDTPPFCDPDYAFGHSLRDPPIKRAPEPDVPLGYDFDVGPGRAAGTYIGVARYKHLPNQVLVAIADERPKIIEIAWMPKR